LFKNLASTWCKNSNWLSIAHNTHATSILLQIMALKGAMKCVASIHNPYEWGNIDNVYKSYKTRIIKQVGYHFQSTQLNIWGG
jgi:hypothetical protein